jgi:enoyl-CoA hydratase/carnithine racemase
MTSEVLQVERRDHVAILTMNRPESLNAMSQELVAEMHSTLDAIASEFPEIRAVVLTGNGRGFCAGTDMKAISDSVDRGPVERDPSEPRPRNIGDLGPRIRTMPQPVIAAVNGVAVGAGFAIVLAADLRIASEAARFAGIFVNRSLPPDGASSYTLAAIVGPTVAAEMLFTGRIYDAEWASKVGLVNAVVPAEQLLPDALALAEEIASKPPIAIRVTKELMYRHEPVLQDIVEDEMAALGELHPTDDFKEAIASFVEKRAPTFHGR